MITLIISRTGMIEGTSIIPTANILNPYFLFGAECTEDNQLILRAHMDKAEEIWTLARKGAPKGGQIPDYTLRTLLLWQDVKYGSLSYPEIGCIPGIQSFLMCIFASMQRAHPERDYKIITTSEYIVRCSQLLVGLKVLDGDKDIQVFDTDPNGVPQPLEFQLSDTLDTLHF